ncbi:MAG: ImmA/IrrE family metallo-endopeptidase [Ruminococcus sp.]|nr:ImmA/IrrE family metallo-endopeptidase [Ruminococcus sp.]
MYRNRTSYEIVARKIIDIYIDYGIDSFPIDEKEICRKLGIKLLPYSDFPSEISTISNDAFYIPPTNQNPPIIVYNDKITSEGRKRFSIFHELKHYVCNENEETKYGEDMADYFARYFMCPIPVLIYKKVDDIATIISDYGLSYEAATNVLSNLKNRRKYYGNDIMAYEMPLIKIIERSGAHCL